MRRVPMLPVVRTVMRHPSLWGEALRAGLGMVRLGWWRRPPFLPVPDKEYVQWRVATAYGSSEAPVATEDVVAYLTWRRRQRISR